MQIVRWHTGVVWLVAALIGAGAPTAGVVSAWSGTAHNFAGAAPMCALEAPLSIAIEAPRALEPSSGDVLMCPPALEAEPPTGNTESVDDEAADRALRRARRLAEQGDYRQALLHLRVVEHAYPVIADRLQLLRGYWLLDSGEAPRACEAFARAGKSVDSTVRVRAEVGSVRCLIAAGSRRAASELTKLQRRYRRLPEEVELRYRLARVRERDGQRFSASRTYRDIDRNHPGTVWAKRARERIEALREDGIRVPPLRPEERVDRAERLVHTGPLDEARETIGSLLGEVPPSLRGRVHLLAAKLARLEGRWADARRHIQRARNSRGLPEGVTRRSLTAAAQDAKEAAEESRRSQAERRIRKLKGWRPYRALPYARLLHIVRAAAPAGLTEHVQGALEALRKKRAPPRLRYDAALLAIGAGADEQVGELLEGLRNHPRYAAPARYYYARTLERRGKWAEAEAEHLALLRSERRSGAFYRMWAEQRLTAVREAMVGQSGKAPLATDEAAPHRNPRPGKFRLRTPADDAEGEGQQAEQRLVYASLAALPRPEQEPAPVEKVERDFPPSHALPSLEDDGDAELAETLAPLAERLGEAYPWLPRAVALLKLGWRKAAADELHEAYLAWRHARGRPLRRAGLEAVYRGDDRRPRRVDWKTRMKRRRGLDEKAKQTLIEVAKGLGDVGIAVGFDRWETADERPRAYEKIVDRAAAKYGIDPNLLFAVMRVESIYQSRIVSYAGAVGLMQIMPRTGRLIADALGRENFSTAELLEPETNIEFAAWYLSSLLERFEGRLPLAIASYNGGPHNVRRWIRDHPEGMPVDAFCEHIPFGQTHRYVRRVLGHYAAYRKQQGLPMQRLSTVLPQPGPDSVAF